MDNESKTIKPNWKAYPAIFEVDKEDPGWVNVTFPDIYPGVTCGSDMDDAYRMAEDLLALMLDEAPHQCFPPTPIEKLHEEFPKAKVIKMVYPCYHPPVNKD